MSKFNHDAAIKRMEREDAIEIASEALGLKRWFRIHYSCDRCGCEWDEEWSCACDSECPNCEARDISPVDWEEIPDAGLQP